MSQLQQDVIDIRAPTLPESVVDCELIHWIATLNQTVRVDDVIVELETDKVILEVVAPFDGALCEIIVDEGKKVESNQVIARFSRREIPEAERAAAAPESPDQSSISPQQPTPPRDKPNEDFDNRSSSPDTALMLKCIMIGLVLGAVITYFVMLE